MTCATAGAATDAALAAQATMLIGNGQAGLSAATAPVAIGVAKLPADLVATAPAAGASLRALTFTDANNWFYRAMEATAADNTPDANGLVRYYDDRAQHVAGEVTHWGFQSTPARQGDLHWNGSAWVGCPFGFRSAQPPRDARGHTNYNYCKSYETGVSTRAGVDISGKALTDVIATIRALPGSDSGVAFAKFGPTDLTKLGTAAFPSGSALWYYTNQSQREALTYIVDPASGLVRVVGPALAGGDATACAAVTGGNFGTFQNVAATLEDFFARNPGKPCVFGQRTGANGSLSLPSNEWWDQSSVNVGTLAGAATPPSAFYSSTEVLRVAFAPTGNGLTYLSCLNRASDNSSRNCTAIGTSTYTIQTLGDARVLTLNNPPLEAVRLGYARVFVERAGQVYYGHLPNVGTSNTVRLNLPAANALLTQLGIPAIVPN